MTMNGTTTGGTVIFTPPLSHRWKVIQECIQDSKTGGEGVLIQGDGTCLGRPLCTEGSMNISTNSIFVKL